MQKNPGHRYEVLTDDNDLQYVEHHYGPAGLNRPDIVELYRDLKVTIVKADLLRYLVMYAEGGVYADIDVEALKPFQRWIPERFNEADINMIIGIEIDQPEFNTHSILGKKSQSFCQWTFACKPHLPVMMRLIEQIQRWLHSVAKEQNVPLGEIHLDFDEVISGTGPSAFTTAILQDMTARNGGQEVSWPTFHALDESKLVGGVLVLTVEAFAAGQGHSDSGNHNARGALVKHHYHASQWPKNHPRFNHPMFGEVEKCNWVRECVEKWDADVAAFALLPPDEQAKQIEIKRAAEATLPGLGQPPVLDFPPAPQAMHNMDPVAQQQGQFPNPPPPGQLPPPMQAPDQGPPPAAALPGLPFPELPKEVPQEQPAFELH